MSATITVDHRKPGPFVGWDRASANDMACFVEGTMSDDGILTITSIRWGSKAEAAIREHLRTSVTQADAGTTEGDTASD